MKTKFILLAAAATVFAACSNNESDEWAGEIRLSSSLSVQQTATRAGSSIQSTAFDASESIAVNIQEATVTGQDESTVTTYDPLTYTTGANGVMNIETANQPYYPTSGNGVNIYAVYPAGTGSSFTIMADQSTTANYKASDLMYAKASSARTSDNVKLTFAHLLSKVTVKLVAGTGTPDVSGAKVELIDVMPTATFTADYDGYTVGTASGDAATNVTVMTTTTDVLEGSAVVIPQTLATEFIKVTLAEGGVLYGSLDNATAGPTFAAGNEYIYTITVNLTGLNIESEITGWNTDEEKNGNAYMKE